MTALSEDKLAEIREKIHDEIEANIENLIQEGIDIGSIKDNPNSIEKLSWEIRSNNMWEYVNLAIDKAISEGMKLGREDKNIYYPIWQCGGILGAVEGEGKDEDSWQFFEMQCNNFKEHRFILKGREREELIGEIEKVYDSMLVSSMEEFKEELLEKLRKDVKG